MFHCSDLLLFQDSEMFINIYNLVFYLYHEGYRCNKNTGINGYSTAANVIKY